MIRSAIALMLSVVGAALGGAYTAKLVLDNAVHLARAEVDGWTGSGDAGATDADLWTRAAVAKVGLMALNKDEAVYFSRSEDQDGRPLLENCAYRIAGSDFPARWWSLTVYASDDYLARNDDDAHSIDATRASVNENGSFRARLAPTRGDAENWLSTRATGRALLLLRLYHPEFEPDEAVKVLALPRVELTGCDGEA